MERLYHSSSFLIPYGLSTDLVWRGQFGNFWRTNFDYRLYQLSSPLSPVAITFPDGGVQYFDQNFEPVIGTNKAGSLTLNADEYVYENGAYQLLFSSEGLLRQLRMNSGEKLTFRYYESGSQEPVFALNSDGSLSDIPIKSGSLVAVELKGETIYNFSYDIGNRIHSILNSGDRVVYQYGAFDNLVGRKYDDGQGRNYLYEDVNCKNSITGIIDEKNVRFATWRYDEKCRAISSEHAGRTELFELDYQYIKDAADPRVIAKNPLGKNTIYHFSKINGSRRLTLVEGQQSENCLAANQNHSYYPSGLLKSKTDWKGGQTEYSYNSRGQESSRIEALGSPQERTITTEWHPTFNLRTKVTEPGKETNFIYDAEGRLLSQSSSESPLN